MIDSIEVTDGYAIQLPAIKDRKFTFTPGVNVLFGPNGCGKSTLINIMAGYCGCGAGDWTKVMGSDGFPTLETEGHVLVFPDCIAPKKCKAKVAWDGTPAFLSSSTVSDAPITTFGLSGLSMGEEISELMTKPSDGQRRLSRIHRLMTMLKKRPDIAKVRERASELEKAFAEYVSKLPRKGPITVLLDEPDRSLSIENQAIIWAGFPNVAKNGHQIIVATHSLLPILRSYEANVIDMEPGYLAHSKKVLDMYIKGEPFTQLVYVANELRKAEAMIVKGENDKKTEKKGEKK